MKVRADVGIWGRERVCNRGDKTRPCKWKEARLAIIVLLGNDMACSLGRRSCAHRSWSERAVARGIALSARKGGKRGMCVHVTCSTYHNNEIPVVVETGRYPTTQAPRKRSREMLSTSTSLCASITSHLTNLLGKRIWPMHAEAL